MIRVYYIYLEQLKYNDNWHTKWCFGVRSGVLLYIAFTFLYPMFRKNLK